MNDDESAFYVTFECFDEEQVLEGIVVGDTCIVNYDKTGFVSSDAQLFFEDVMENESPWQSLGKSETSLLETTDEIEEMNTSEEIPNEQMNSADDIDEYLWEVSAEGDLEEAIKLEKRNYKIIQSMQPLFEEDSYKLYSKAVSAMKKNQDLDSLNAALQARESLVQIDSVADRIWFLWGEDNMPIVDGESYTEEELDKSQMDAYGSKPLIIKYLLDDPTQAKGNIVAVSGGAMKVRSNGAEGYPAAERFNSMGYNVFLLQRRVEPYSEMDIYMDYQRAVRVVRYYAEKEGYGGTNMIAGVGWSGGGETIMGAIDYCYGNLTPVDEGATSYVPDEIDSINSDLDVAMILYGTQDGAINTDNTNWPAFYICAGTADTTVDPAGSEKLFETVKDFVPAKLNMIEGAEHGFGVGVAPATGQAEGTEDWPDDADVFMQENLGHSGN